MRHRAVQCERTRSWASLAVDGELSDFERVLMEAHLERCHVCAAFAAEVAAVADALRAAALEPLSAPVVLPLRRRAQARTLQLGAAAALVVGAIGLAGLVSGGAAPQQPARANVKPALLALNDADSDVLLKEIRLKSLKPAPAARPSGDGLLEIPI